MNTTHYIGLDVHKKSVSYCIKLADGTVVAEGKVASRREDLRQWAKQAPQPWEAAREATLFSGWIYDTLCVSALQPVSRPADLPKLKIRGQFHWSRTWMLGDAHRVHPVIRFSRLAGTISVVPRTLGSLRSDGKSTLSLDNYLSWMPHRLNPIPRHREVRISTSAVK